MFIIYEVRSVVSIFDYSFYLLIIWNGFLLCRSVSVPHHGRTENRAPSLSVLLCIKLMACQAGDGLHSLSDS